MKHLLRFAAIGCSLPSIEAGGFKWNSNQALDHGGYVPAQQTGDLNMQLQPVTANPQPTSPPELRRARVQLERALSVPGSVCGYMSHDLDSTLACAVDNTCLFTTYGNSWVAGCCPTTSTNCPIVTTCVGSSAGNALSSIGVSTYWCSSKSFPVCVTLSYQDMPGYTIFNCGGPLVVTEQTIDHSLGTTTSVSTTSTSTTTDSSTSSSSSGSTTSSSSTSTATSSHGTEKSSAPLGAIIGGAVGGAALIAIIVAAIIFFVRRSGKKKKNKYPPTLNQGVASGPPPSAPPPSNHAAQPAMAMAMQQPPPQQHYQGGEAPPPPFGAAPYYDPRASIQKHPYDVQTHPQSVYAPTLSTPGSPPPPPQQPPSPGPGNMPLYPQTTGSPPPQQPFYQQQNAASQPPHQGQGFAPADPAFQPVSQHASSGSPPPFHNQAPQHNVTYHEVPATRHDGELRELA